MSNIVVLGTGMAGMGAAYRLHGEGIKPVVYDKNPYHGGHTASFVDNGFLFDLGPHISFTKDERIQGLLADAVDQKYESVQVNLTNYWQGFWPTHPVQLHLHGLPAELVVKVISDFVAEAHAPEREVKNYADWLLAGFGRTFAETFPMTYARKYHTTTAENMSTDWLGPRMYRPSLDEILLGALSVSAPQKHYITHFRYPSEGGFLAYLKKFVPLGNLKLGHELVSVDPKARQLTFANGLVTAYEGLVSSVPLPELIRMIPSAPPDVRAAAQRLACTTCVLVNVGLNRHDLSPGQITYFYDEDLCFARLSFPHMLAASNVPNGTGSIQAEVYFSSKYRPLTGAPEDMIEPVIRDLRKVGLIKDGDDILYKGARLLRYANIIFDLERAEAVKTVHAYLDEVGISYCGRYGDWGYMWTDESFISGERAAEQALTKLKASA